uniref:Uncharacterized protein n=1 Tax=Timema poppense TaxID=170557 RepID=A0A7R9CU33_TIMPO|nr:unnamed protein product [Timema poppensis]
MGNCEIKWRTYSGIRTTAEAWHSSHSQDALSEVTEGFGNQINLFRDRGLNPGPPAQKSDTLPLDHQGSDPRVATCRGKLQNKRSKLNQEINKELRLRAGAENLFNWDPGKYFAIYQRSSSSDILVSRWFDSWRPASVDALSKALLSQ